MPSLQQAAPTLVEFTLQRLDLHSRRAQVGVLTQALRPPFSRAQVMTHMPCYCAQVAQVEELAQQLVHPGVSLSLAQ
ncbi:hypothetical protein D3C76_1318870 [compost metagenome]